jgi:hypothetical protein
MKQRRIQYIFIAIFFYALISIFNGSLHSQLSLFFPLSNYDLHGDTRNDDDMADSNIFQSPYNADGAVNRVMKKKPSFLLLNETNILKRVSATSSSPTDGSPDPATTSTTSADYSIDVLVVGSQFKLSAARTQFKTWGSHKFVRNFIVSTEYDDPFPNCSSHTTLDDVARISGTCKRAKYWMGKKALNPLTQHYVNAFGRFQWLRKKKNPAGWICAQRRFISSFVKLVDLYEADGVYPDYLIVADDDTYINMENITEYLLLGPQRLKEERGIEDDNMYIPTPISPTIFAGCRIRSGGVGDMIWTLPFGGYGVFLSQGALKRLTQSIHCDHGAGPSTEYEQGICDKYLKNYTSRQNIYPFTATIGEEAYFQSGDSLNQVFSKYVHDIDYFCLHSDWFFGYIANFLNVSRHVSQKGELPLLDNSRVVERSWYDEDENTTHFPVNRLHTIMSSDFPQGNCMYGHTKNKDERPYRKCVPSATICHYIKEEDMEQLYLDSH